MNARLNCSIWSALDIDYVIDRANFRVVKCNESLLHVH